MLSPTRDGIPNPQARPSRRRAQSNPGPFIEPAAAPAGGPDHPRPEQAEAGRGFNRWTAAGIAGGVGAWVYGVGMVVDFGDQTRADFHLRVDRNVDDRLGGEPNGSELRSPGTPQTALSPLGPQPFAARGESRHSGIDRAALTFYTGKHGWARRVAAIREGREDEGRQHPHGPQDGACVDLETGAVLVVTIQGRTRGYGDDGRDPGDGGGPGGGGIAGGGGGFGGGCGQGLPQQRDDGGSGGGVRSCQQRNTT